MRRAGSTGDVGDEVRDRLGVYRVGERRAIAAVVELLAEEQLEAVGAGMWEWRGWVVVATDGGLRLVRRPRVFGRARDERFDWADLTAVRSRTAGTGLTFTFGDREIALSGLGPPAEFARLLDAARGRLARKTAGVTVEEIRSLAQRELGRLRTVMLDPVIADLPDQLETGERVLQVAGATLGTSGLLVITDRRVLLSATASVGSGHVWSVARRDIWSAAAAVEHGLRFDTGEEAFMLTSITPAQRRFELADLLASEADREGAEAQRDRGAGLSAPFPRPAAAVGAMGADRTRVLLLAVLRRR